VPQEQLEWVTFENGDSAKVNLTRRRAIALFSAATLKPSLSFAQGAIAPAAPSAAPVSLPLTAGPFTGSVDSLAKYEIPAWYGEAKFGIWSHWGPQSGVEQGDWYARNMYIPTERQYKYHLATYGPQSKVGYKDLVPMFKGAEWDPEHLMDLYQKAGAKYFFSMGVHHDNFDMWNSKHQPRWNAVATGPKRDIVGEWAKAARKRGLRFGVSEHLSNSYDWLAVSHLSDPDGSYAGIPYDGTDPAYADLYHDLSPMPADFARHAPSMGRNAPDAWKMEYYLRVKDLVDQHEPDMLYTDGGIPFNEYGLSTVAEVYNVSARKHGGKVEAVYFTKTPRDVAQGGVGALDRERGVAEGISPVPWQTDTCIGGWHYQKGGKYKSSKKVIDLLVDIVSKNGNLLLNFPLPNSGQLDPDEMTTLEGITAWMAVNSEGIYATKPWKIYGEGPSTKVSVGNGGFNEGRKPDMGADDIRYTTKGPAMYAFVMGWPTPAAGASGSEVVLPALGTSSAQSPAKVHAVSLLGGPQNLKFVQEAAGLRVTLPAQKPGASEIGITLKVMTA
jgi:alpha-L-fucosidase